MSERRYCDPLRTIVLCAALMTPAGVMGQGAMVVARIAGGARIVKIDPSTGHETRLYEGQLSVGWLHDIRVAPSGRYIAVLQTIRGHVSGNEYDHLPHNQLLVLDTTGKVVEVIERDVRRFTWCGSDAQLAFITGQYHEGGVGFLPESVYVHDVSEKSDKPLPLPARSTEIGWAAFDSSIYVGALAPGDSLEVWRYHLSTGAVAVTPYRSVLFSPSGDYYLEYSTGLERRAGWHLAQRISGREMPLPDTSLGAIQGWVFSRSDQLLLAHGRRSGPPQRPTRHEAVAGRVEITDYVIYDVRNARPTQRGLGRVLEESSASRGLLPVVKNGKVEVLREPEQ